MPHHPQQQNGRLSCDPKAAIGYHFQFELLASHLEESTEGVCLKLEKTLFDELSHCERVDHLILPYVVKL